MGRFSSLSYRAAARRRAALQPEFVRRSNRCRRPLRSTQVDTYDECSPRTDSTMDCAMSCCERRYESSSIACNCEVACPRVPGQHGRSRLMKPVSKACAGEARRLRLLERKRPSVESMDSMRM